MITCERCSQQFDLNEAQGAAMVSPDGKYFGCCPGCGFESWPESGPSEARHSDESIVSFVEMMELAGDNFCQRCVDLLWERHWRAQFMEVLQ